MAPFVTRTPTQQRKMQFVVATLVLSITAEWTSIPAVLVGASDADPLQDFCVADVDQGVTVNGYPCKPASLATGDDFSYAGLRDRANLTGSPFNASATFGFVQQWPALNHLGVSVGRLDIAPGGVIIPHTHNLATEVIYVLEGEAYTGFVTNDNKLYAKTVRQGEAFIFPRGLLHFQINRGTHHFTSINFLNGQNPGLQLMPLALFGAGIDADVISKSFFLPTDSADSLISLFTRASDAFFSRAS